MPAVALRPAVSIQRWPVPPQLQQSSVWSTNALTPAKPREVDDAVGRGRAVGEEAIKLDLI